jgi:hypothetical protein
MSKNLLKTIACSGVAALAFTATASAGALHWKSEVAPSVDPFNPIASPAIEFAALYGFAVFGSVAVIVTVIAVASLIYEKARKGNKGS